MKERSHYSSHGYCNC